MKDFKMAQVPADSSIADLNAKPLGKQRTKYLMNLIGYWHSEEQTVGEHERKVCEEKKNFAGKINKIAKMLVRMVALEGLQPIVTEALTREKGNVQCGLEELMGSNENGKFWITVTIAINIIGFAAVTFVVCTSM